MCHSANVLNYSVLKEARARTSPEEQTDVTGLLNFSRLVIHFWNPPPPDLTPSNVDIFHVLSSIKQIKWTAAENIFVKPVQTHTYTGVLTYFPCSMSSDGCVGFHRPHLTDKLHLYRSHWQVDFWWFLPNSKQNNRKHLSGYILKFSIIRIDFFFIAGNRTPWLSLTKRISVFLVLYCYGNKRSEPCGNHIVTNTVENEKRLLDDLISHQQKLVQKKRQQKREINVWLKVKYAWDSFMCGCVGGLQWIAPLYYYSVNCTTRF